MHFDLNQVNLIIALWYIIFTNKVVIEDKFKKISCDFHKNWHICPRLACFLCKMINYQSQV